MSIKKGKLKVPFVILAYSGGGSLNVFSKDEIKQTTITKNSTTDTR
jgi:hypothetical protein